MTSCPLVLLFKCFRLYSLFKTARCDVVFADADNNSMLMYKLAKYRRTETSTSKTLLLSLFSSKVISSVIMNSSLILVLAVTFLGCIRAQAPPQLTLYESPGCTGASTSLNAIYAPELASRGFDNRARSASIIGTWLFYDNANYNILGNAGSEYAFHPTVTCMNFQVLGGYVSSARYPGYQLDYRSPTITFYAGTYFQGAEEYEFEDDASLDLHGSIKSFIITGESTQGWTLYDRPNYEGNAVCVYPPPSSNFEPALIKDTRDIGIPDNAIASLRKRCQNGARVASFVPAPTGVHIV